jgi:hypothetical protein
VNSLPPGLVKVMATPRDIALAIRIRGDTNQAREISEVEGEKMEDLFDEVGMEYMDESSLPEDDDERRMSHSPSSYLHFSHPFNSKNQDKGWRLTNSYIDRRTYTTNPHDAHVAKHDSETNPITSRHGFRR